MQHLPPRRIAAIHDFSCVGRCALTVVIPTLSVMGYQTVPLPTALLSSHTGGFEGLYFRDLTNDMHHIAAHFDRLEMTFGWKTRMVRLRSIRPVKKPTRTPMPRNT